tara:strand:+ start:535 stop:975 length:441 start_codon:yes stop_codon:yes gene_type:complete
MIDLLIEGKSKKDVAKALGMAQHSTSMVYRTPIFQEELTRRREARNRLREEDETLKVLKAHDVLESKSARAASTLGELLDSSDDRMRLASANSILDRTYGRKADDRNVPTIQISGPKLINLNVAFLEAQGKDIPDNLRKEAESTVA